MLLRWRLLLLLLLLRSLCRGHLLLNSHGLLLNCCQVACSQYSHQRVESVHSPHFLLRRCRCRCSLRLLLHCLCRL